MKPTFFKGAALGAATSVLVLLAASALAGTGVGDVFNLGQTNSVDATSSLQGTLSGGAQLQVTNQGSGAAVRGDSQDGRGVFGNHVAPTGTKPGVEGGTSSTDANASGVLGRIVPTTAGSSSAGVRGINGDTGIKGYGVWGSHAGFGVGVYGSSNGTGVLGVGASGIGVNGESTGNIGVHGGGPIAGLFEGGGYGVVADGAVGGEFTGSTSYGVLASGSPAGRFNGDVLVERNVEAAGNLCVQGAGGVKGYARIPASSSYSSSFVTVTTAFDCLGGTVQAERVSGGRYRVKFPGLTPTYVVVTANGTFDYFAAAWPNANNAGTDTVDVVTRNAQGVATDAPFVVAVL
jgi:hypothetical protein